MKKFTSVSVALIVYMLICIIFLVWALQETFYSHTSPLLRAVLFPITLIVPLLFMLPPVKFLTVNLHVLINGIGKILGGLLSGYSFSAFSIGRYEFIRKNGRIIRKKYPKRPFLAYAFMAPPEIDPLKCPYKLLLLGGNILWILIFCTSILLFFLSGRHLSVYVFLLLPTTLFSIYMLPLFFPHKSAGMDTDTYLAFIALPRNPSLRNPFYLHNKYLSLEVTIDDYSEMPTQLCNQIILLDYSRIEYSFESQLLLARVRIHHQRNEFEEERKCRDFLYTSPNAAFGYKAYVQRQYLFEELTGLCRREEIEKYFDKAFNVYLKVSSANPSTKTVLYAYDLLYKNDFVSAQKDYKEIEKILAAYPDKEDVNEAWEDIRKIHACASRKNLIKT
jgi:hypothetical protein